MGHFSWPAATHGGNLDRRHSDCHTVDENEPFLNPSFYHSDFQVAPVYTKLQELQAAANIKVPAGQTVPPRWSVACMAKNAVSIREVSHGEGGIHPPAGQGLTPLHFMIQKEVWDQIKDLLTGFYAHSPKEPTRTCPDFAILWFKLNIDSEQKAELIRTLLVQSQKELAKKYPKGRVVPVLPNGKIMPSRVLRPSLTKTPLPDLLNPSQLCKYSMQSPNFRVGIDTSF